MNSPLEDIVTQEMGILNYNEKNKTYLAGHTPGPVAGILQAGAGRPGVVGRPLEGVGTHLEPEGTLGAGHNRLGAGHNLLGAGHNHLGAGHNRLGAGHNHLEVVHL